VIARAARDACAVILAAGLGTRLRSAQPKVLHSIAGRPLVAHVAAAARAAGATPVIVVIRPGQTEVGEAAEADAVAIQDPPLGTADAARRARPAVPATAAHILLINGDLPLIRAETIAELLTVHVRAGRPLTLLTCTGGDPRGYGRVRRDACGALVGIVEEAAATLEERELREWNAGLYCARASWLWPALERVRPSAKGEYYLTDFVALAAAEGGVGAVALADPDEAQGINTREELAAAEAAFQRRLRRRWLLAGVTMAEPESVRLEVGVELAPDVALAPQVQLTGATRVEAGACVGPGAEIRDSRLGAGCRVGAARLRGARLAPGVVVGDHAVIAARSDS
jgi:bifunctional UDP-N-acetylglucosamine pyrophosphorylase/glucosamine-1-phosphate N-acetyltransferase